MLRAEGREVALLTCFDLVAHYCDQTLEGVRLRRRLHDIGIAAHRGATAASIDPGGVTAADEFGAPFRIESDGVVLVTQRLSRRRPPPRARRRRATRSRRPASRPCTRSATASRPRLIADAIFDGHRLAARSTRPTRPARCPTCASARSSE